MLYIDGVPGVWVVVGVTLETFLLNEEQYFMVTTGELRAIIQELHLVDVGEAASYLGEEAQVAEESEESEETVQSSSVLAATTAHLTSCDDLLPVNLRLSSVA